MFFIFLGIIAAAIGGELFVRGTLGFANSLRIPPSIAGVTVAAFATSSPEAAVAIRTAAEQTPQLALGDALGSNIANIGLIFGISLLFFPIQVKRSEFDRDFFTALTVPLLLGATIIDGEISKTDGIILLSVFCGWLILCINGAKKKTTQVIHHKTIPYQTIIFMISGLAFLIVAGYFIVRGGLEISKIFSLNPILVGSTLIAFGTSTPELATTIISGIKKHNSVGISTILGSNIFNSLFVIGLTSILYPIKINTSQSAIGIIYGVFITLLVFPNKNGALTRQRGLLLIISYITYVILSSIQLMSNN